MNADCKLSHSYLDPRAESPPLNPVVASSESQYRYLWCTAGTSTYTFLGTYYPGYGNRMQALYDGIAKIQQQINTNGDGPITDGWQVLQSNNTNIRIYAEDRDGNQLTWGLFQNALVGLRAWMQYYGSMDATFQINNGSEEVGAGYIGSLDSTGKCQFSYIPAPCAVHDSS